MPMVAQPLLKMPEPWKMDLRLLAVRAKKKNKMASLAVRSMVFTFATIGIPVPVAQSSQRDKPRDFV
jgi:hypothetical protein